MKNYEHLMLDIETMGNESFSSIVSIGAVEFDINTGETGRKFYVNIDLQSCIDEGLIMNASTVMWWLQQNEEARNDLTKRESKPIREGLEMFSKFCNKEYQVWGNSARFDCGCLGFIKKKPPPLSVFQTDLMFATFLSSSLSEINSHLWHYGKSLCSLLSS